ncbi:GRB2-associated-binding protein 1 isoform X1 [Homalodisca vitripennis]|uniref:GRB2-associated-binding protein 1 isoform X1 n=2 Tax=Homalodisca vitripennis TaxID=197043 RepID=UPI001EEA5CCC|nr:GRB2-associated-binding protein 1 isoform X1 [Homalodisca vitripennis]
MSAQSDSLEIVHEGWLTKSPPTKSVWRARWRKRWFVLRHSGELPGQYFLCYYTDKNCRRLKGRIDLDQCEQVDAGLRFENRRKQKYQYMFDVRTPKRTYFLAAETEEEMNKWVDCVCHVCGLKAYSQYDTTTYDEFTGGDEESPSIAERSSVAADSPPTSPTSTASGPYIPISECISGKPLSSPDGLSSFLALQQQQQQNRRSGTYDAPRCLHPPQLELRNSGSATPPLQSPATDGESVFTDEEWTGPAPKPNVNWETFPRPSDSSADGDTPNPNSVVTVGKRFTRNLDDVVIPVAPPRPPKPSHLVTNDNNHSYSNIEEFSNGVDEKKTDGVNDETYDFPRSHNLTNESEWSEYPVPQARHCYSNAAPGRVNGDVFRYDFASTAQLSGQVEASSPAASDSSSVALYSNLPSPAISLTTPPAAPPVVNRGLKPGRKDSIASNEPSPVALPSHPPSIDRKLKPVPAARKKIGLHDDGVHNNVLKLSAPPLGRLTDGSQSLRRIRAAPSPTPQAAQRRNSDTCDDLHAQEYFYDLISLNTSRNDEIQYLDLALGSSTSSPTLPVTPPSVEPVAPSTTVYKTVDFLKTVAFNRTREKVEQERKGKPVH